MSDQPFWKRRALKRIDATLDDKGQPEIGESADDTLSRIERELEHRRKIAAEGAR